jgi:ribosomal protein S18 acetylase RimI-like enzyme
MALPQVRKAERADGARLAALAETTFRDTFSTMNTPENMELHCRHSYGEAIQAAEIVNPHMVTFLSEHEGELVGFAQLRWGKAPDAVVGSAPAEILRLYVARSHHGRGVAHDLMRACLAEAAQHRSDIVWLGVWERNPRAIAFYRKFGFAEVGAHVFALGEDPQRDIVMSRPI